MSDCLFLRLCAVASWLGALVVSSGCSPEAESTSEPLARPVTTMTLQSGAPEISGRLVGLATPYRQETIGFEVNGRAQLVQDVGLEVDGPTLDADGRELAKGDVLGSLDPARYQQVFDSRELQVVSASKDLEAQKIEVETVSQSVLNQAKAEEQVALEEVNNAEAQLTFAQTEMERQQKLLDDGISSRAEYDNARLNFDSAEASLGAARRGLEAAIAGVAQAEDNIKLKRANIEKTKAVIAEQEQQVEVAQTDLNDCVLHAPFPGRITERHVGIGALVNQGEPIVTLTMMDPMKVVVMTSAEKSRKLLPGTQAAIIPQNLSNFTDDPALYGVVLDKAEVADPATRTFRVEVIARNLKRRSHRSDSEGGQAPFIDRILPAITREADQDGPLFVNPACLSWENGQAYVYRLPGVKLGELSDGTLDGVLQPERLAVQLRDEFFTLRMVFQRTESEQGLEAGDLLIVGPKPEHAEGVVMARYEWAIRPGDIVPVSFDIGNHPSGFYVPVEAISVLNGDTSVFVVGQDRRVRRVSVSVRDTVGQLKRVESESLSDGMAIVLEGIHYLSDGDQVQVVSELGGTQ